MSLIETKLGDLVMFQRGFDITKSEQIDGEIPVISSGGTSSFHNAFKAVGPGVIIGRKGTLGTVHYVESNYWPHDTTLWVKDFKGNDPKFMFYFLQTLKLERFDAGASNPTLNRNHIHKLRVTVPDKKSRIKIASILSTYDELIENNNQRIFLLEQMAEEIYKEWFVRLRFPRHQNTKKVNGVPEGWEQDQLENIIKRVPPGKLFSQNNVFEAGRIPVLDQGRSGIIGFHNEFPGVSASLENPIIVFANHTCYQRLIHFDFSAIQNVLPFKSNTDYSRNIYWLHHATKDLIEFNDYKGHWPEFMAKKITIPSSTLADDFGNKVKSFYQLKHVLILKNENLKQTRDLLLPRLISGKLSVKHLMDDELSEMVAL